MGPRGRRAAIVTTIVVFSMLVAGARGRRHALDATRPRCSRRDTPPTAASSARSTPARKMTVDEKLQQVQLLVRRADHRRGRARRASARSSASSTRRRSTTSSTSRSSSRGCTSRSSSPTTRSTATARSSRSRWARRAASTRRWPPPTTRSPRASRRRSASSRSTARWSTSPTSRAGAASPRPPARTPTWAPSSRPRASRPRRATTTRRPTRSSRASSTSPPTASPRAAVSTTRPTCPSSGCATSTCRRSRRRSTPGSDTVMCSFNAISGVPGCADPETETDILKSEWGFDGFVESDYTAVAELRACPPKNPNKGPCGHGVAADGPGRGAGRAQRRHRLRDGEHEHPRLRQAAAGPAPDLDGAPRRRGAADPAREVPRRALRAPLRRPGQGRRSGQLRDR